MSHADQCPQAAARRFIEDTWRAVHGLSPSARLEATPAQWALLEHLLLSRPPAPTYGHQIDMELA